MPAFCFEWVLQLKVGLLLSPSNEHGNAVPAAVRPRLLCDRSGWRGIRRGDCMPWGWGGVAGRRHRGLGEARTVTTLTPRFLLPKIRWATHKLLEVLHGRRGWKRPLWSGVHLSVKAPWVSRPSKRQGQERWGHISWGLEQHRCNLEYIIWGRLMKDAPKPWEKTVPCSDLIIKDHSKHNVLFITHWYLKEQQPLFLLFFLAN